MPEIKPTDRIADLRTLMASALVSQGIGMTLLVAAPAVAATVAAFLLGLGMGGGTSLTLVLVTRTTRSASEAARLNALVMLLAYPLSATAPVLFGLAHDVSGAFRLGCAAAIGIAVLGLAAVLPLRPHRRLAGLPLAEGA